MTNTSRPRQPKRTPGPLTKMMRRIVGAAAKRGDHAIAFPRAVNERALAKSLMDRGLVQWGEASLVLTVKGLAAGTEGA